MSDILAQFKALKLYGMASSYAELKQQNTPDVADSFNFADTLLNQLLQAETTERNLRSIRYQTQAARFPVQRHLQGFDFSQSKVDCCQQIELSGFIANKLSALVLVQ